MIKQYSSRPVENGRAGRRGVTFQSRNRPAEDSMVIAHDERHTSFKPRFFSKTSNYTGFGCQSAVHTTIERKGFFARYPNAPMP